MRILFLISIFLFHLGISEQIIVARDPQWYPLDFGEKTPYINAYTQMACVSLSSSKLHLKLVDTDWINLFQSLNQETAEAVLSAIPLNTDVTINYDYTTPILCLGPVLIVRKKSVLHSMAQLSDRIVGLNPYDQSVFVAQQNPKTMIKYYEQMFVALDDLIEQNIDAVLLDYLTAHTLIPKKYPQLKIVSEPLNQEGIRFFFLKTAQSVSTIKFLDKQIKKFQTSNQKKTLLKKYLVL